MDLKEKELLLKDLSARLPYGVIVNIKYSKEHGSSYRLRVCSEGDLKLNTDLFGLFIQEEIYLKPFLRPMDSMTDEEWEEYNRSSGIDGVMVPLASEIDWLNSHYFDFRGLIDKGLALEAPDGMYGV